MKHLHTVLAHRMLEPETNRHLFTHWIFMAAFVCLIGGRAFSQGVAINSSGTSADTSAMLDVSSVTKGMLIPRMTKTQRNAIPLPATGLLVYQTTRLNGLYLNVGTPVSPSWVTLGGDSSDGHQENTAFGLNALYSINDDNSIGFNTAIGSFALFSTSNGEDNTAIGHKALYYNTIGSSNTAIGGDALANNTGGVYNIAIGTEALSGNTTGYGNTACGPDAIYSNMTGFYNTGIGAHADVEATDLVNATAIGANSSVGLSNTMVFGDGNILRWGFGVNAAAGHAFQVGTNGTNGNGAYLTTGGVWTNASDRNKKENFSPIDGEELLKKIDQLPITIWNYKGESKEIRHIGPMAQDFKRIFNLGNDDKSISTIDPAGIALAAIQVLNKRTNELDQLKSTLTALVKENAHLKKANDEMHEAQMATAAKLVRIEAILAQLATPQSGTVTVSQNQSK